MKSEDLVSYCDVELSRSIDSQLWKEKLDVRVMLQEELISDINLVKCEEVGGRMDSAATFFSENWEIILTAVITVIGGGIFLKWRSHRQTGSSSYSDQRNAHAKGDIVGRDKVVGRDN